MCSSTRVHVPPRKQFRTRNWNGRGREGGGDSAALFAARPSPNIKFPIGKSVFIQSISKKSPKSQSGKDYIAHDNLASF